MKTLIQILTSFTLLIIIANSCLTDQGPIYINPCPCDTTPFNDCDCDSDTISFVGYERNIQPLWDKFCIECHDGNIDQLNLKPEVSYNNIIPFINTTLPEASEVYQMMYMNLMPPEEDFRLTNDELDLVLAWIIQGAKDN